MESFFDDLNDFAVELGDSDWVYSIVFAFSAVDGFFPPVPSESVVVALAAIGTAAGDPNLWLLALAAGLGAFVGDNIAFRIGRAVGVDRFDHERRPRLARTVAWARHELDRRAAVLILTARYIPVGRVAVNMTAGATGFPYRRFGPLAALGAVSWSGYSVLIGVVAGTWVKEHPLIGAAIAVVIAAAVGYAVDAVLQRRRRAAGPDQGPATA